MMAIKDVAAVGGTLLQLVDSVQRFGNNYYRASAAWLEFPRQINLLRAKHVHLEAHLGKYGLLEDLDPFVLESLKDAKQLMLEEVDYLQKRRAEDESHGWRARRIITCSRRLGEMFFPEKVGLAVQNAIRAYDDLQRHFRSQHEDDQMMRSVMKTRPISLFFDKHSINRQNYVPLRCESRIYSALRESSAISQNVVLLYGGLGKGKSTVARQVSLTCENEKSMFSQVFMLECGVDVNANAKEIELLQKLGCGDMSEIHNYYNQENCHVVQQKQFNHENFHVVIQGRLQRLLKEQKLLIILDDLWDPHLLQSLLNLSGPGVKYLVTSQQKDLCKNLSSTPICIQIDDLQESQSRRMLAIHIGFPNQIIPDDLQEMADRILIQAEGIPLVIAMLGAHIAKAGEDIVDVEVWKCALENCIRCLNRQTSLKSIHGTTYSRTYWSALQQSVDKLSEKEKHLFFLLALCKGPSVPQYILLFFCSVLFPKEDCDPMQFAQWKTQLRSRHLVLEKDRSWLSIHSLTKRLLVEFLQDTLGSIVQSLVKEGLQSLPQVSESSRLSQEIRTIIVLVCLYIDVKFSGPLALQIGLSVDAFGEAMRSAIEPITELLANEVISSRSWTGVIHLSARQVFLEFTCKNAFDHDHISQLLGCEGGVMKTFQFLENASLLGESFWQKNTVRRIPCSLSKIFQAATHPDFQVRAAKTLAALCICSTDASNTIVNTTGMLHELVHSLSQHQNPALQCGTAKLISTSIYFSGDDTSLKILDYPGMLSGLVHNLATAVSQGQNLLLAEHLALAIGNLACTKDATLSAKLVVCFHTLLESLRESILKGQSPVLQTAAARAVANLGWEDQLAKERILNFPKLLDSLVTTVDQDQNSGLAGQATRAICHLTATENSALRVRMSCFPNLLESMGKSLSKSQNPALQRNAAWALANLSLGDNQSVKEKILHLPQILDNLVKLVGQDQNSGLAEQATRAVCHLSAIEDSRQSARIALFPNLLESLAACLSKGQNHALQKYAAWAVARLCTGDQLIKEKIFNLPGLMDSLVKKVNQDENPGLGEQAARAICSLACIEDSTLRVKIACFPNLLETLGKSLSKAQNPALQATVARAITNLGWQDQSIKKKIFNLPGMVDSLVKMIDQSRNSSLAEEGTRALCHLAAIEDSSLRAKVACFPNLLQGLGGSLSKGQNPTLQKYAAWTLASLGSGNQTIMEKIFDLNGVLDNLVKLVNADQHTGVAEQAARAICTLAATENLELKAKMCCFPSLLESLGASVSKGQNLVLQMNAAWALANLGFDGPSIREKVVNLPGLLDSLVKLVNETESSGFPEQGARAIRIFAATGESAIQV